MDVAFSSPAPLYWIPLLLLGIPLLLWLGLASTLARRDAVDRPNRIAQWYGYSVCLVAVVVLLVSSSSIVNSLFTLANPMHGGMEYGPALTSFEAYRATWQRADFEPVPPGAQRRAAPTDAELRARYEALRADRVERNRYEAQRSLVSAGLLTLLALALFVFHWRWLQRLAREPAPLSAAAP